MVGRLPVGYTVRLAIVRKVGHNYVDCEFYDRFGEKPVRCPIPHPYPSRGGGILIGIEPDTLVLLANRTLEKWVIVGFVPDVTFYNNVDGLSDVNFNETPYPELKPGEIVLKGPRGQKLEVLEDGRIALDVGIGNKASDFELSPFSKGMFVRVNNFYKFTEAGRSIEGIIRRDLGEAEVDESSADFLTGTSYDMLLSDIGRSPNNEVHVLSSTLSQKVLRNPALIEKRNIVYEFADSFDVRNFGSEVKAMRANDENNLTANLENLPINFSARYNRRTDVLNLNANNYNHLLESVQGTLVDIYGNILDINRNKILIPDVTTIDVTGSGKDVEGIKKIYTYLRRSVKYHFEINSRKKEDLELQINNAPEENDPKVNSKWSVDVDAEGLTKINIPASSDTGNIPVLGRYTNSIYKEDPTSGAFRDKEKTDIKFSQFGAKEETGNFAGHEIVDSEYSPKSEKIVTAGTAYHDLFKIANSIFTNGKWKTPPVMNKKINNKISEDRTPNAGGRSLHINLDGSVEASIGADTIDRKSLVLDLEGGTVSHFGRDLRGRSIIHQSDGDVIIQVGGTGISEGDTENKPGRIEIHLNRPDATPQKIIIDEDGLTIDIKGNGVVSASGDLILSAGGSLLLNGELIKKYGSFDIDKRTVGGSELLERRKGFSN